MGQVKEVIQDLSPMASANIESGSATRWNHLKTIALVTAVLFLYFSELLILVGGGAFSQIIATEIGGASLTSWPSLSVIIFTVALAAPLCQAADYWGRKWFLVVPNIGGIIGAIISARATTMGMFIAGFCVGGFGFGSQGLFLAVVSEVLPRKYRSWGQAAANAANALGSIFALSVGGYFVSKPEGFRTYLYICAAIYAAAVLMVIIFYNPAPRELQITLTFQQKVRSLDWIAYLLIGSGTVLLCLGLSWAQNPYPWKDVHVVVPILIGAALLIVLFIYAWKFKNDGLFHHDLFRDRNFAIALIASAMEGMIYMAANIYFPTTLAIVEEGKMGVYRQALCFMVGFCGFAISAILVGFYIYKTKSIRVTGVLTFIMFLAFCVSLATVTATTPEANFWGYILFFGVGLGMALVTFVTAAQFATPPELIAVATGLFASVRSLGGSVGLAIFNALSASGYTKNLVSKVTAAVVPLGLPERSLQPLLASLTGGNVTGVESLLGVTTDIIKAAEFSIKQAHIIGFRDVFICGASFMLVGLIAALFLHNPTLEFNAKIDAPIDIASEESEDRDLKSRVVAEQRVEHCHIDG